jgi:hypothetical protein
MKLVLLTDICYFMLLQCWGHVMSNEGCAIAQAVSRWLPTAAARVQARVWSCGICGGQSGAGAGFLWVLRFPLPIFIPPIAPQSPSSIIWGLYNRSEVAAVPSGLSPTPQKKKHSMCSSLVLTNGSVKLTTTTTTITIGEQQIRKNFRRHRFWTNIPHRKKISKYSSTWAPLSVYSTPSNL